MTLVWCFGPRDLEPPDYVRKFLPYILSEFETTTILHGGARGVDSFVGRIAEWLNIPVDVRPADWERHGRRAGPLRNEEMAKYTASQGGRAICIRTYASTPGTSHSLRMCSAYNVPFTSLYLGRIDTISRVDSWPSGARQLD